MYKYIHTPGRSLIQTVRVDASGKWTINLYAKLMYNNNAVNELLFLENMRLFYF